MIGLDKYTLNARLKPALLTALPVAILIVSWPGFTLGWSALWALLVTCGSTMFLSQVARDRGKRLEPKLFDAQGGRPSDRLLSHAHASNNSVLLAERHRKLRAMLPHLRIPTREEELEFPGDAREVYAACVAHLIAKTRGDALLLQENINYGFRRNLLGLKPFGVSISVLVAVISGLQWLAVPFVISLAALAAWLLVVRPDWPSIPSNAYAARLLEWLDKQATPPVAA